MSPGAPLVMPTRILIVGGGGREHALAWKLSAEPGVNEVLVTPGSAAIAREPRVRVRADVDPLDGASVVAAAPRATTRSNLSIACSRSRLRPATRSAKLQ